MVVKVEFKDESIVDFVRFPFSARDAEHHGEEDEEKEAGVDLQKIRRLGCHQR